MSSRNNVLSASVMPGEWWGTVAEIELFAWGGLIALAAALIALGVPVSRRITAWRARKAERALLARREATELVPLLEMACDSLHRIRAKLVDAPGVNGHEGAGLWQVRGLPEIRVHLAKPSSLDDNISMRLAEFAESAGKITEGSSVRLENIHTTLQELASLQMNIHLVAFDVKPRDSLP